MSREIRTIGRHTLVYGTGIVIGKLASFIMLPIYTRYLTPADYGVLELLGTTIDVIGMIAGIGIASGVFKYYAEFDNPEEKNQVVSTVALATMGLSGITAAAGVMLAEPLTHLVFGPRGEPLYFRLFFLIYFLQSIGGIPFMLIRAQQRSTLFVTLNLAKLVAMLALNIYLVVQLRLGILGVLVSNVVTTGALALYLTGYSFHQVGFSFSWAKFRHLTHFGTPLILWSLGSFVLTFSDRYFLNYFGNTADVGVYSLAYKFAFLLSAFAMTPFELVWEPRRYEIAKQPEAPQLYGRMFLYLNVALVLGAVLIQLFVKDVLRLMVAPAFWPAYHVIPLLLLTTVLQQWTAYCNLGLYLKNATHLYGWSAVLGVAAVLVLNALLIPPYGMIGAAWATVAAYAIRFAAVYVFAQSRYRIEYAWGKVALLLGLFFAAYLLRSLADSARLLVSLGVSTGLLALVTAAVYAQLLTEHERRALRGLVRWPFHVRPAETA